MKPTGEDFPIGRLPVDSLPQFAELPQPPEQLWIRGSLPSTEMKFLSVVGSRAHSSYGKAACEELVAGLKNFPVCIVSGLALGIDAIAHRAALKSRMPTVAFPGSGLDWNVLYPATHQSLAREILASGGALVSEFDHDFRATPWSFPKRNRLVAGIADAVLVIEAKEKSGALITARLGTEYNKTVMAIPGPIYSEYSKGTNWLLKLGAVPVTNAKDIARELGFEMAASNQEAHLFHDLTDNEALVLKALVTPLTRFELEDVSKLETQVLNIALSMLEIKGYIAERMGKVERIL